MLRSPLLMAFLWASSTYFLCLASPFSAASVTAPFSRLQIPSHVIERRVRTLRSSDTTMVDTSDLVYEVSDDGLLIGPHINFNIRTGTRAVSTPHNSPVRTTVNGKLNQDAPSTFRMRQGGGYTVLYEKDGDAIVRVWGHGLILEPLDQVEFPNVFVNTQPVSVLRAGTGDMSASPIVRRAFHRLRMGMPFGNVSRKRPRTCYNFGIAVAFDNKFCEMFSNSESIAMAYVQATVNFADSIFRRDTCHSITLVHVEAHCQDPSDPYHDLEDAGSDRIFDRVRNIWNSSERASVKRDLAYFFSGFGDGTSLVGRASAGKACTSSGVGWVEHGSGQTFVHELGHSLGANHSSTGIMQDGITKGTVLFADESVSQIRDFLAQSTSCTHDEAPPCDESCPGGCVNNHCIALYHDTSSRDGLVPCIPVKLYKCTKGWFLFQKDDYFDVETDCPPGFDFLKAPFPEPPTGMAQKSKVFCCRQPSGTSTADAKVVPITYPYFETVTNPAGEVEFEYVVNNPNDVAVATLMDTELVPSCYA